MIVELKVNNEIHLINTDKICFVSLGDGSLPAKSSLSVWIYFEDRFLAFSTNSSAEANKLYKRIKKLINNEAK